MADDDYEETRFERVARQKAFTMFGELRRLVGTGKVFDMSMGLVHTLWQDGYMPGAETVALGCCRLFLEPRPGARRPYRRPNPGVHSS